MLFKCFYIFSFGGHFVQWNGPILANEGDLAISQVLLACAKQQGRGSPKTFQINYLKIQPMAQEEMLFKGFYSIFSSDSHFLKGSYCKIFSRGCLKEQFCEIIFKSGNWPRRRCCLKVFSSPETRAPGN